MIDAIGRHLGDAVGQFNSLVVGHLEGHAIVEFGNLFLHGFDDLRVAVTDA